MKPPEKTEVVAIIAFLLIMIGLPLIVLGYQFLLRPSLADLRTIEITAAAPEVGGFQPEAIRFAAGETVLLRFSVPDVTHGIAIGPGLDLDLGHVDPGEVKEVRVSFEHPGRYTYYCNTWCSPSHWRMRGIIDVYDPADPDALVSFDAPDPVLESLISRNVNIDGLHESDTIPAQRPSAAQGGRVIERLGDQLPAQLNEPDWRDRHSPVEAWSSLRQIGLEDQAAWDAVAYLWLSELNPSQFQTATTLYAKNCAACHGEHGEGQGPGTDALAALGMVQERETMPQAGKPTPFTDPKIMLGGSNEI